MTLTGRGLPTAPPRGRRSAMSPSRRASRSRRCPRCSTTGTASPPRRPSASSRSSTTSATRRAWSHAVCATSAPTSSGSWSPTSNRSAPSCSRALPGRSTAPGYELRRLLRRWTRTGDHVGWERRYLSRLAGTLIDGAVLVTPDGRRHAFRASRYVAVDPHTGRPGLPTVDSDNLNGARARDRAPDRAGAPTDRHDRRARRPRVGAAARGGLPPGPGRSTASRSTPT